MKNIVSETVIPPVVSGMEYWERTSDPWHEDAFKGTGVDPHDPSAIVLGGPNPVPPKGQARRMGWMAIDWCENPVGFVPDGHEFEEEPGKFILGMGPCKHTCAYPDTPYGRELKEKHAKGALACS